MYLWGKQTPLDPILGQGETDFHSDTPIHITLEKLLESSSIETEEVLQDQVVSLSLGLTTTAMVTKFGKLILCGRLGEISLPHFSICDAFGTMRVIAAVQFKQSLVVLVKDAKDAGMVDETSLFLYSQIFGIHFRKKSLTPILLEDLCHRNIVRISAGTTHIACVTSNGEVYYWDGKMTVSGVSQDVGTRVSEELLQNVQRLSGPYPLFRPPFVTADLSNVKNVISGSGCLFALVPSKAMNARGDVTLMSDTAGEDMSISDLCDVYYWGQASFLGFRDAIVSEPKPFVGFENISSLSTTASSSNLEITMFGITKNGKAMVLGNHPSLSRLASLRKKSKISSVFPLDIPREVQTRFGLGEMFHQISGSPMEMYTICYADVITLYYMERRYILSASLFGKLSAVTEFLARASPQMNPDGTPTEKGVLTKMLYFDVFGNSQSEDTDLSAIIRDARISVTHPLLFGVSVATVIEKEKGDDFILDDKKGVIKFASQNRIIRMIFSSAGGLLCGPLENSQVCASENPIRRYTYNRVVCFCFDAKYIGLSALALLSSLLWCYERAGDGKCVHVFLMWIC